MARKKLEDAYNQIGHFKMRVNQLLDFIEEMGMRNEFEKWAKKNIKNGEGERHG